MGGIALPFGGIACGCVNGVVALWSAAGERVASLGGLSARGGAAVVTLAGHTGAVTALAVLPDGCVVSLDGTVRAWA